MAQYVDDDSKPEDCDERIKAMITSTSVTLEDIVGHEYAKKTIKESITFSEIPGTPDPWKGILLYGPPGTGKTMLAAATAGSFKATFFNARISDILSKYLGESSKIISDLYKCARNRAPSIIFLDEIDSIASIHIRNTDNGAERRILDTLLIEMDGLINKNSKGHIVTMAATNTPWDIDHRARRRFEKQIYIPLPDEPAVMEMIKLNTRKKDVELDVDIQKIAQICVSKLFSGSNIEALCKEAHWNMWNEQIQGIKDPILPISWGEIPGNDSLRLIDFLKQKFSIDWVKTAKIEKVDNGRTIKVYTEKNYISLKLIDEKTNVNLEIDDGRTAKLIAKKENDKLNIYFPIIRPLNNSDFKKAIETIIGTVTVTKQELDRFNKFAANNNGLDIEIFIQNGQKTKVDGKEDGEKKLINSIGMEFMRIPAGEFMMGSEESDREKPVHKVTISKAFYLGVYPVTQQEWKAVMKNNPSNFNGENLPVERVSWKDVQEFIKKLNENESTNKYRMPSEAEWEYAARTGMTTKYSFGDDESKLGIYAWYIENSGGRTHDVGKKEPNQWGLHDMHGNVQEWVQDSWHENYNGAQVDGKSWEGGDGSYHVIRGGSWNRSAGGCRSALRNFQKSDDPKNFLGFRLVRDL